MNTSFEQNEADMISALHVSDAAIASPKASKAANFVQLQIFPETGRKVLDMADALDSTGAMQATWMVAALLQQGPAVPCRTTISTQTSASGRWRS